MHFPFHLVSISPAYFQIIMIKLPSWRLQIRKSLEEHFSSCGEVSRVSVPKDQDGCARGFVSPSPHYCKFSFLLVFNILN